MFRMSDIWFFLFFCSLQEDRSLYWTTSYLFYVPMLNNEMYSFFLIFFFLTFKNQESVFITVFLILCPCSYDSS